MKRAGAFMRLAIELSARGFPAPNPHVGCVIVSDGRVVGEGWHAKAGAPHAEAMALRQAGELARGATAYVTLEPCDHHGRTPPCSLALIEAGIARVVVACPDPNPLAAGGCDRLRAAGIEVSVGIERWRAAHVNRQFLASFEWGRPYVYAKCAISLDGRVALSDGSSRWITGRQARWFGHRLRAEAGAVLVGRTTVERDDPALTVRLDEFADFGGPIPEAPAPLRIVIDPQAKLDRTKYRVFDDSAETWWVTGDVDLSDLLARLSARSIRGLLVEGGPTTVSRFIAADLIDELHLHQAPKPLGNGPTWFTDAGRTEIESEATWTPSGSVRTLANGDRLSTYVRRSRLGSPNVGRGLIAVGEGSDS